jgi:hypothetical protein
VQCSDVESTTRYPIVRDISSRTSDIPRHAVKATSGSVTEDVDTTQYRVRVERTILSTGLEDCTILYLYGYSVGCEQTYGLRIKSSLPYLVAEACRSSENIAEFGDPPLPRLRRNGLA